MSGAVNLWRSKSGLIHRVESFRHACGTCGGGGKVKCDHCGYDDDCWDCDDGKDEKVFYRTVCGYPKLVVAIEQHELILGDESFVTCNRGCG